MNSRQSYFIEFKMNQLLTLWIKKNIWYMHVLLYHMLAAYLIKFELFQQKMRRKSILWNQTCFAFTGLLGYVKSSICSHGHWSLRLLCWQDIYSFPTFQNELQFRIGLWCESIAQTIHHVMKSSSLSPFV